MPVAVIDQRICFLRLDLSPSEILGLLERHAENYPGATQCERDGAAVIAAGFPPAMAMAFVEKVVRWGGGQRFVQRVLTQNTPEQIADTLQEAHDLLVSNKSSIAVTRLQELRYLGQSFASKVARFIVPDHAVILDEVIRTSLGYREDEAGYEEFLSDCHSALSHLSHYHPQLRVCDVEAAIFAKIQGY